MERNKKLDKEIKRLRNLKRVDFSRSDWKLIMFIILFFCLIFLVNSYFGISKHNFIERYVELEYGVDQCTINNNIVLNPSIDEKSINKRGLLNLNSISMFVTTIKLKEKFIKGFYIKK